MRDRRPPRARPPGRRRKGPKPRPALDDDDQNLESLMAAPGETKDEAEGK